MLQILMLNAVAENKTELFFSQASVLTWLKEKLTFLGKLSFDRPPTLIRFSWEIWQHR